MLIFTLFNLFFTILMIFGIPIHGTEIIEIILKFYYNANPKYKFHDPKGFYPNFDFKVLKKYGRARLGMISTPHGKIQTPAFIFCATKASMKSTTIEMTDQNNSQIILSNTYHLGLKGHKEIKRIGGLHKALGWKKPMLTDSGGYQVFAMNHHSVGQDIKGAQSLVWKPTLIKITEKGALFHSYYDRSKIELTPEYSIEIQRNLGADLMVVFDECTSSQITREETMESTERSHRWEKRSLDHFIKTNNYKQALYGIVQGGVYKDLREESCQFVNNNPFFGVCVGGCLGETTEEMYETVEYTMKLLKRDRPVHLLGIGYIRDIFNGVKNSIDTFDCVHPTRMGRRNFVYVKKHKFTNERERKTNCWDLTKLRFSHMDKVIDDDCGCTTCNFGSGYKVSYLHLLIKMNEKAVVELMTNHNIYFMNKLMEDIRHGIMFNNLEKIEEMYV